MHRQDPHEHQDGELPEAAHRAFIRRGRRYTPPGEWSRVERDRRAHQPSGSAVQIGDVVAELTPRQAVVWLMNLDTMISLYESTTEHELDSAAREQLVRALRRIVREQATRP